MKRLIRSGKMITWPASAAIYLLASLAVTLSSAALQPGSVSVYIGAVTVRPLILILNWIPCLCAVLFLGILSGNVLYGASAAGLFINILSYINRLKIEARNDPLVPADVTLLFEGITAANEYKIDLSVTIISFIALFSLLLLMGGIFVKGPKLKWPYRALGGFAVILASAPLFFFVYKDKELYRRFETPQPYNMTSCYNDLGFNYSFIHNISLNALEKPEGYSKEEVEAWISEGSGADLREAVHPHIIMVMCEAFSDLSEEPVFDYQRDNDPLNGFKRVCGSDRAISGHIVTTAFGGGTAETEFNVLTGMKNHLLSSTAITGFRTIRRDVSSLPRVYGLNDYRTCFMHPGYSWFYGRNSVYEYLGISDQTFVEAFSGSDYKGALVSDEAFGKYLGSSFLLRASAEKKPIFYFSVSIQNHQSYFYTKYGFQTPPVPVPAELTEASREQLSVYMEGVRDSSGMLLELTEFLDGLEEPVLLVFFGDHRPGFKSVYSELGLDIAENSTPANTINTFKVPFVIWENEALAKNIYFPDIVEDLSLPANTLINDNYLGSLVYEITGMSGRDPFFDFLCDMRRKLPVFCYNSYCLPDGMITDTLTDEQKSLIDKLDKWSYYRLRHENIQSSLTAE